MNFFKNTWNNLTKAAEARVLRARAVGLALVTAALQLAPDGDTMSNWTRRRWAIFAGTVLLSFLVGAHKAGDKNPS